MLIIHKLEQKLKQKNEQIFSVLNTIFLKIIGLIRIIEHREVIHNTKQTFTNHYLLKGDEDVFDQWHQELPESTDTL